MGALEFWVNLDQSFQTLTAGFLQAQGVLFKGAQEKVTPGRQERLDHGLPETYELTLLYDSTKERHSPENT